MNKQYILFLLIFLVPGFIKAGGISVDAGITPPQDRFIFRTQYRYMSMENSMMTRQTQMVPFVFAYGVTSGISVMTRAMYVNQSTSNSTEVNSGLNDLYLLTKFRLYRKNTPSYVFGIAPHLASNIPVGSKEISNRLWNPEIGLNVSFRPRFLSFDLSASYVISDISGKMVEKPGNILNLNTAISGIIPLNSKTSSALSPVLETTFTNQSSTTSANNNLVFLSPGISFIYDNLTLEALVQLPVYQTKSTGIMEQNSRWIIGFKSMF